MYDLANLPSQELNDVFLNTSKRLRIPSPVVEKDFWVCLVLDYLFTKSKFKERFILKGGTSLSKGFGYINRFSEDIDLVIKYTYFDSHMDEIFSTLSSNTHRQNLCDDLNRQVEEFVKNELMEDIKTGLESLINKQIDIEIDPIDHMSLNLMYPISQKAEYLLPHIKIELGALSSIDPIENVKIAPYVYLARPDLWSESSYPTITIYSPERTFLEKINTLHINMQKPIEKHVEPRFSRHLYDLYCLGHSPVKDKAISNDELLFDSIRTTDAFYHYGWLDIDQMYKRHYKLVPPDYRLPSLREDYKMMESMILETPPSFDEILSFLNELEEEINKCGQNK